jgi:hypothetical protein
MARIKIELNQRQLESIENLAGMGLSVEHISAALGISKKTLERRVSEGVSAKDAMNRGRAKAIANVSQTAYNLAVSGKCPMLTVFWLKVRARWSEAKDTDQPVDDDKTTTVYETQFGGTPVTKTKKTNP